MDNERSIRLSTEINNISKKINEKKKRKYK